MAVQAPALPASLQLSHTPLQAALQQNPSVQIVLAQSVPTAQSWPLDFLQSPPAHS